MKLLKISNCPYDKLYQTNLKISLSQILIIAERISKILIDIEHSLNIIFY